MKPQIFSFSRVSFTFALCLASYRPSFKHTLLQQTVESSLQVFKKIGLKDEFNVSSHNKIGTAELAELIASLLVLYFFYISNGSAFYPRGRVILRMKRFV